MCAPSFKYRQLSVAVINISAEAAVVKQRFTKGDVANYISLHGWPVYLSRAFDRDKVYSASGKSL